jgi:putative peptidoglycan lipid II flippase
MACTMTTRLLGFVKNAIIAALFGATGEADVLNAVFNIPNTLRKLMAEGALSSAFIPVLTELQARENASGTAARAAGDGRPNAAGRLVADVVAFLLVVLVPVTALAGFFPSQAVRLFTDFALPAQVDLAAGLFRWIAWYLLLVSLSAILMGALNTHNSFVLPALTPLFFSFCVIGALLFLRKPLGIYSLAVGVLSGGVVQVIAQIPAASRLGYRLLPSRRWLSPDLRRVLKLWVPFVAASSIYAVNQLIALRFASGLAEGSASAMSYAVVFWQLPFGVLSASVTTVLFPRMSRQAAEGDTDALRESTSYGMRLLGALLVPAAVFFVVEGRSMIEVAYQRGEFTAAASALTTNVLTGYSVGLASVGLFTFVQRVFYAVHDYRTPLWTAGVVAAVDIGLSIWLKDTPWGVVGLAVANSAAFTVGLVLLCAAAHARLRGLDGRRLVSEALRVTVGTGAAAGVLVAFRALTAGARLSAGVALKLALVLAGFALFLGATLAAYRVLRVQAATDLLRLRGTR